MKTLRTLFTCGLLLAAAHMMADKVQVFTVEPVTIEPGGTSEIVVNMDYDTDETVVGYDFSLYLPEGVSLNTDVNEADASRDQLERCITLSEEIHPMLYDYYNDEEIGPKAALQVRMKTDGGRLVLWIDQYYPGITPLKSTHGELMRIAIKASSDFKSDTGKINNISITSDKSVSLDFGNIADVEFGINQGSTPASDSSHNYLYLADTEGFVGTDVTLSVNMKNTVEAEGFGFDLVLPSGITVATDADGYPMAYLSTERTTARKTNTFEATIQSDGTLRVFAASTNGSTISGNDGEVCTVTVHIASTMAEGSYTIKMKNISISDVNAASHDTSLKTSTITIHSYILGDANGDGKITVADYTAIAHHVLGNTPSNFVAKAADANQDGKVNVADYTAVAHLILYGTISKPSGSRLYGALKSTDISQLQNTIYIEPLTATPGDELTLSVRMKNSVEAEGFSFDLYLPEGMSVATDADGFPEAYLSTERTTARKTNTFEGVFQADGSLRVFAASTNGSAISGNDGEVCTVKISIDSSIANGDYTIVLRNISISDVDAVSHDVEQIETSIAIEGDTNAIAAVAATMQADRCYDLNGRVANNPGKGIYVVNGRKVILK